MTASTCTDGPPRIDSAARRVTESYSDLARDSIATALRYHNHASEDISVELDGGIAWIRGRVRTFTGKQRAQITAMQLDGIDRVENRIEVVETLPFGVIVF